MESDPVSRRSALQGDPPGGGERPVGLRFLLFDLDETLYPADTGMFEEIGALIHQYLEERLGIPHEEVPRLRRAYYERYGTTLRGLQLHHQVDPEDYLAFVHSIDVTRYLRPNPALDEMLSTLPQEKVLFTNASTEYACRVLEALGIRRHFRRIFDIQALDYHCKPDPRAYRIILEALPAAGPECLLIEDTVRNLKAGHQAGMRTLLVGGPPDAQDGVDFWVPDILQVPRVVRALSEDERSRAEHADHQAGHAR
jgi:putative hydrolase of the HAD superfamily